MNTFSFIERGRERKDWFSKHGRKLRDDFHYQTASSTVMGTHVHTQSRIWSIYTHAKTYIFNTCMPNTYEKWKKEENGVN